MPTNKYSCILAPTPHMQTKKIKEKGTRERKGKEGRKEEIPFANAWMDLADLMLCELEQVQKKKKEHQMILHTESNEGEL